MAIENAKAKRSSHGCYTVHGRIVAIMPEGISILDEETEQTDYFQPTAITVVLPNGMEVPFRILVDSFMAGEDQ